jgi:hypothetical protein
MKEIMPKNLAEWADSSVPDNTFITRFTTKGTKHTKETEVQRFRIL